MPADSNSSSSLASPPSKPGRGALPLGFQRRFVRIDGHEVPVGGGQLVGHVAADPPEAADDEVAVQLANLFSMRRLRRV